MVAINRRIVGWNPQTGSPEITNVPMLTKAQIVDIVAAAVSLPYKEPGDDLAVELGLPPSEFYGMTNMEVMLIRLSRAAAATGSREDVETLLDRLLGRPHATSETIKTTMTYEDRLKDIQRRRMERAIPVAGKSAEIITVVDSEGGLFDV